MIKYAFILASLLALTACQSNKSGRYSQTDNGTGSYGASQGITSSATDTSKSSPSSGLSSAQPGGQTEQNTTPATTAPIEQGAANQNLSQTQPGQQADQQPGQNQGVASTVQPGTATSSEPLNKPAETPQMAPGQETPAVGTPGQGSTSIGTAAGSSDSALTQSVTNSLSASGISADTLSNIHVRSMNGRVILSGKVASQFQKDQIEKQVKKVPGVQSVNDLLRVQGAQSGVEQPSAIPGQTPQSDTTVPNTAPNPTTPQSNP
jgi:hypothetical protein